MTVKPRVLVAHNSYRQRGGEDAVVDRGTRFLRRNGRDVVVFRESNQRIAEPSSSRDMASGTVLVTAGATASKLSQIFPARLGRRSQQLPTRSFALGCVRGCEGTVVQARHNDRKGLLKERPILLGHKLLFFGVSIMRIIRVQCRAGMIGFQ